MSWRSAFAGGRRRDAAAADFSRRFSQREAPEEMAEIQIAADADGNSPPLFVMLKDANLAESSSAARRLIAQGAVRADGEVCKDLERMWRAGDSVALQAGRRRFARVTVCAAAN